MLGLVTFHGARIGASAGVQAWHRVLLPTCFEFTFPLSFDVGFALCIVFRLVVSKVDRV